MKRLDRDPFIHCEKFLEEGRPPIELSELEQQTNKSDFGCMGVNINTTSCGANDLYAVALAVANERSGG